MPEFTIKGIQILYKLISNLDYVNQHLNLIKNMIINF